jgi:hypothetical protein
MINFYFKNLKIVMKAPSIECMCQPNGTSQLRTTESTTDEDGYLSYDGKYSKDVGFDSKNCQKIKR